MAVYDRRKEGVEYEEEVAEDGSDGDAGHDRLIEEGVRMESSRPDTPSSPYPKLVGYQLQREDEVGGKDTGACTRECSNLAVKGGGGDRRRALTDDEEFYNVVKSGGSSSKSLSYAPPVDPEDLGLHDSQQKNSADPRRGLLSCEAGEAAEGGKRDNELAGKAATDGGAVEGPGRFVQERDTVDDCEGHPSFMNESGARDDGARELSMSFVGNATRTGEHRQRSTEGEEGGGRGEGKGKVVLWGTSVAGQVGEAAGGSLLHAVFSEEEGSASVHTATTEEWRHARHPEDEEEDEGAEFCREEDERSARYDEEGGEQAGSAYDDHGGWSLHHSSQVNRATDIETAEGEVDVFV